jgi:Glyoxalase/Bleomycin resistance protein/Dioxygenase superfamily
VGSSGPTLAEVTVGDDAAAWRVAGFAVDDGGHCRVGAVGLRLAGRAAGPGMAGWTLAGVDDRAATAAGDVDGVPTAYAAGDDPAGRGDHPNGVVLLDHLVMVSPDLDRTTEALGALGIEARRTREAGRGRRQRFFRLGEAILELVGPAEAAGTGPAHLWGLAFTVVDLDATVRWLGEHSGGAKEAVQPGRRIATLHAGDEVSVPVAFMSGPGGTAQASR